MHPDDTIAALATPAGPGARAVVRLSGPGAWPVAASAFAADDLPPDRPPARGLWSGWVRPAGARRPLPGRLLWWPGPRSYTGQDLAELHAISSPPLLDRLMGGLLSAGARAARPGEFTLRAFLAGKKDLPRAEAVLGVIEARTDDDLRGALRQLAGGVSRPLDALRDDLLNLLADVEAALDFADEDIEFVGRPELLARLGAGLAHLGNVARQLDERGVSGRPVRVALVGEPNAGKTSLFNALSGGAGLVSPTAGTTRDYLAARLDVGGVPVELLDTAGWEAATSGIAGASQQLGREQSDAADVILWCVPAGEAFDPATAARLASTGAQVVRVATKCDLHHDSGATPAVTTSSAATPDGLHDLRATLTAEVEAAARPAPLSHQGRARHHVAAATRWLREAHGHALHGDPPELLAAALRAALDEVGALSGAVYTDDLLDRVFSRFCIGK